MKRIFFVVLAAALCVVSVDAAKKDKKDKKDKTENTQCQFNVQSLKSSSDSLSYAGGYANTNGLIPYLQQQLKVDTAYMADFIQGLKDKGNDPRFVAYNAGAQIQQMLEQRMISGIKTALQDADDSLNVNLFYAGFLAALNNDSTFFKQDGAMKCFEEGMKRNDEAKKEKLYGENRRKGEQFLAQNSTKDSVVTLPSGLQYKVLTMGTGPKPKATQEVHVKYEGKLVDGKVFDSSYTRKDQVTKFRANQVIKGWTEALQLMPVGSKWELYIPQELGYGDRQSGQIPPYSALIFTVELVDITPDATAKPAAATATEKPAAKAAPAKAKKAAKK